MVDTEVVRDTSPQDTARGERRRELLSGAPVPPLVMVVVCVLLARARQQAFGYGPVEVARRRLPAANGVGRRARGREEISERTLAAC